VNRLPLDLPGHDNKLNKGSEPTILHQKKACAELAAAYTKMDGKKIIEFPDVENKLQAPTKKSVFERQKELEREKRAQEEAETAAVYEDFVKSFDDEDSPSQSGKFRQDSGFGGFGGVSGPPRRHFGGSSIPTGPASGRGGPGGGRGLGSGPGSLGPPPNLSRKRAHEGFQQSSRYDRRDSDRGLLAFEDYESNTTPLKAFNTSDDEDEKRAGHRSTEPVVAKPTLRLSSLPPGTSPAVIKALLPRNITVDAVRIMPPSGPSVAAERKSMCAIVTLSKETPANDIDAAVNALQNRYLGYGFYLSLHRHLSSAAISSSTATTNVGPNSTSMPFGAKPVNLETGASQVHAPPGQYRGFAPPTSYTTAGPGQAGRNGPLLHVPVQPPRDIKELKLIHKTIESMLTHGPEFEALLMSRPEVQKEEKWAWIWDARSPGGVWYRWRLWQVLTGSQTRTGQGKYLPLFEDSSAWKAPDMPLAFEYATRLDEFVSDSD
jgi:U2-associated protein SR140